MLFSLGNLLTIAIVGVILAIYRQLDVNNRSLDKMKKYFNKIKDELDAIVEEKAMGLKDLSIELDVHEKTVKEVYNRIEQRRAELEERGEEIEKIHRQLDSYDSALKELAEMTERVDENLKKMHEESFFVDEMGKKLKEASSAIEKLEKKIPAVSDGFARKNSENMELLKISVLNEIELKANTMNERIQEAGEKIDEFSVYMNELEERRDKLGEQTIINIRKELDDLADEFRSRMDKSEEEFRKKLFDAEEQGNGLSSEIFAKIRQETEERAADISADIDGNLALLEERIKQQFGKIGDEMAGFEKSIQEKYIETQQASIDNHELVIGRIKEFEEAIGGETGKINEMKKEIEASTAEFNNLVESCRSYITGYEAKKESIKAELTKKLDENISLYLQKFTDKAEEIEKKYLEQLSLSEEQSEKYQNAVFEEIRKQILRNAETMKSELQEQIDSVDSQIAGNLAKIENGISDFEKSISYRIEGIEGFEKDIDLMEENLKGMISKVSERMRDDFRSFEISLDAEKSSQKIKLDKDFSEIRDVLETLEVRIDELKKKSYENVTEKLQVFEDEFFRDLKERNESIDSRLDSWQKEIAGKIEKITAEKLGMREEIEDKCTETMKEKLSEIQAKAASQYQKYENQISIFKNDIDEKILLIEKSVKEFEVSIKAEAEDIKVSSYNHFNKEFAEYHTGIDEKLRQYEKDLEQRISMIDESVDKNRKELFAVLESARSDIQMWYSNLDQEMKAGSEQLSQQNLKLKEEAMRVVEEIKKEFVDEKNELLTESKTTRNLYQEQLAAIGDNIEKLGEELREKSQNSIEKMKNDSEIFMIDFLKKTRELEQDIDSKIKEFKTGVQDLRERIDNSEKKMMGRIAESARILNITLDDIDKKQKNFVSQTKIFERADTLKTNLQEKIDELKAEIIKVDAQGKDIKVAEKKFDNIRKLGEEVSTKLNRFLAEKRKIDEIEGDFKKLLNMSQAVDIKLDHITGIYDNLQEIDVKLRNFDSLFKDVEEKFLRLEKKESIIESTTEGVDRNFQTLQQMEKNVGELKDILESLPMRFNELENRFKKINLEKNEADKTIGKLDTLSKIMSEVEERIEKMQQAREWLARTETRLNDAVRKAEENVSLLGTLIDKDSKGKKTQKGGAPSMDKREMVVKLAHQGWTAENIAQATGLSRGEVELILEIMPKK